MRARSSSSCPACDPLDNRQRSALAFGSSATAVRNTSSVSRTDRPRQGFARVRDVSARRVDSGARHRAGAGRLAMSPAIECAVARTLCASDESRAPATAVSRSSTADATTPQAPKPWRRRPDAAPRFREPSVPTGGIGDQRIVGYRGTYPRPPLDRARLARRTRTTRIRGGHESHPAGRIVDDPAEVRKRCGCTRALAPNQSAFEVRQRANRLFDFLGCDLGRPLGDQSIRIEGIGRVEQPGGAEHLGRCQQARPRPHRRDILQNEPFQTQTPRAGIDFDVLIEFANRLVQASALQAQRRQQRMNLQFRLGVVCGLQPRSNSRSASRISPFQRSRAVDIAANWRVSCGPSSP